MPRHPLSGESFLNIQSTSQKSPWTPTRSEAFNSHHLAKITWGSLYLLFVPVNVRISESEAVLIRASRGFLGPLPHFPLHIQVKYCCVSPTHFGFDEFWSEGSNSTQKHDVVTMQHTKKMSATSTFHPRYSLYFKPFGNTSGCRIHFLIRESQGYSLPQLEWHPRSALATSQRPRQLCPTYTADSWRTQLMGNSPLDLQKFFYSCNSGQAPEQMFRKVRVFTVEDVQIPPCAQWGSSPCSQCTQVSKSLVNLQHTPYKYPKWVDDLMNELMHTSALTKLPLTKWESREECPNLHVAFPSLSSCMCKLLSSVKYRT